MLLSSGQVVLGKVSDICALNQIIIFQLRKSILLRCNQMTGQP